MAVIRHSWSPISTGWPTASGLVSSDLSMTKQYERSSSGALPAKVMAICSARKSLASGPTSMMVVE